jgi:hypothetical protein
MKAIVVILLFCSFFAPAFAYDFFHTIDSSGVLAVVWSVACLVACCGLANSGEYTDALGFKKKG